MSGNDIDDYPGDSPPVGILSGNEKRRRGETRKALELKIIERKRNILVERLNLDRLERRLAEHLSPIEKCAHHFGPYARHQAAID